MLRASRSSCCNSGHKFFIDVSLIMGSVLSYKSKITVSITIKTLQYLLEDLRGDVAEAL